MGFNNHELLTFKKFAQSKKGLLYSEDKIFIEGCFRDVGCKKIISGDNFEANIVKKSGKKISANLIYKTYLEWYNATCNEGEIQRIFVSAKIGELTDNTEEAKE